MTISFAAPLRRAVLSNRALHPQPRLSSAVSSSSRARIPLPTTNSALPTTPSCPPATCPCYAAPADLDIDRDSSLAGTAPRYSKHLIICTGRADWPSRIEDSTGDDPSSALVRGVKALLGRGGKYRDPFHNVLTSFSSFALADPAHATAYVFPSMKYIAKIPVDPTGIDNFVRAELLPKDPQSPPPSTEISSAHSPDTKIEGNTVLVLICGHNSRDTRCGAMGPILQSQFEDILKAYGQNSSARPDALGEMPKVRVGLVSHVGGHKWAGNVLMYFPQRKNLPFAAGSGKKEDSHPLAGKGVWYGRVEPRHVEGIVSETIGKGRVIEELFRGGIGAEGKYLA